MRKLLSFHIFCFTQFWILIKYFCYCKFLQQDKNCKKIILARSSKSTELKILRMQTVFFPSSVILLLNYIIRKVKTVWNECRRISNAQRKIPKFQHFPLPAMEKATISCFVLMSFVLSRVLLRIYKERCRWWWWGRRCSSFSH